MTLWVLRPLHASVVWAKQSVKSPQQCPVASYLSPHFTSQEHNPALCNMRHACFEQSSVACLPGSSRCIVTSGVGSVAQSLARSVCHGLPDMVYIDSSQIAFALRVPHRVGHMWYLCHDMVTS